MSHELNFTVRPGGCLQGDLRVPGDKSISHRAIMLGALAKGQTRISGFLEGEDSLATLQAFRAMGVSISGPDAGCVTIEGVGMHGLQAPVRPLDVGNSGTSMRLLAGLLCGQDFDVTLTGDASLSTRPMRRIADPLTDMGARIETSAKGTPPLHIYGHQSLQGIDYTMPMASAQVKSAVLLAGLYAEGETRVTEPAVTRDHSERMLETFQWPLKRRGRTVALSGGGELKAHDIQVPGDISSAAFFIVGASIAADSDIIIKGVGINPSRSGIIAIMRQMGADIEILQQRQEGSEPVADIRIRSARLQGIDIPVEQVPLAIDEFPALFIAAACAQGTTRLTGAAELRVKESDRIQVMADGLQTLGADAEATADGMIIRGGALAGGDIESQGDHRIAMAFAVAGLRASAAITIRSCRNVATSFPGFADLAARLGLAIDVSTEEGI